MKIRSVCPPPKQKKKKTNEILHQEMADWHVTEASRSASVALTLIHSGHAPSMDEPAPPPRPPFHLHLHLHYLRKTSSSQSSALVRPKLMHSIAASTDSTRCQHSHSPRYGGHRSRSVFVLCRPEQLSFPALALRWLSQRAWFECASYFWLLLLRLRCWFVYLCPL
jgi:hypothetical protein